MGEVGDGYDGALCESGKVTGTTAHARNAVLLQWLVLTIFGRTFGVGNFGPVMPYDV